MNENCGLPDLFTDYQIRYLGNPSGLPEILLKIDPWEVSALSLSSCLCNGGTPNGAVRVAKDNISPSRPDRKMSDKSDIIFSADYLSFGVR